MGKLIISHLQRRLGRYQRKLKGEDLRLLPQLAEEAVKRLFPYKIEGKERFPEEKPFIVVFNHDVMRGKVTGMPYDALAITSMVRAERKTSPLVATNPELVLSRLKLLDSVRPQVSNLAKNFFASFVRSISFDAQVNLTAFRKLKTALEEKGVVAIAASPKSRDVRTGSVGLSSLASAKPEGVPLVPVRITRSSGMNTHPKYILRVGEPIIPVFASKSPSKEEISLYCAQIYKALYQEEILS